MRAEWSLDLPNAPKPQGPKPDRSSRGFYSLNQRSHARCSGEPFGAPSSHNPSSGPGGMYCGSRPRGVACLAGFRSSASPNRCSRRNIYPPTRCNGRPVKSDTSSSATDSLLSARASVALPTWQPLAGSIDPKSK
jgi:hypothetical protein